MRLSPRYVTVPALVGLLGAAAAACGGGAAPTTNAAAATPSGGTGGTGGTGAAGTGAQGPPGVSGQIASITGSTLEVQDPSTGQTTVNLTPATAITQSITVASSALAVGQCVSATGTKTSSGGVAATNVTIDALVTGACTQGAGAGGFVFGAGGGGGGFGGRFGGAGGTGGSTTRSTLSAAQRAQRQARLANVGVSYGKITAINGSTIEVQVPPPPSTTTTTRANSTAPRLRVTPAASFTIGSSTRFSELRSEPQSSLAVGQCATAFGPSDSTGAVTAQRLSIRPPGPNGCSTGFGGFGRGGFGGGAGGGTGSGTGTGA